MSYTKERYETADGWIDLLDEYIGSIRHARMTFEAGVNFGAFESQVVKDLVFASEWMQKCIDGNGISNDIREKFRNAIANYLAAKEGVK